MRMRRFLVRTSRGRVHDETAGTANYATLLPWLDRLFGTFDEADGARFGTDAAPRGFLALLFCAADDRALRGLAADSGPKGCAPRPGASRGTGLDPPRSQSGYF